MKSILGSRSVSTSSSTGRRSGSGSRIGVLSSSLEVAVVVMGSCSGSASEGISFSSEISSFSDRSSAVYSSSSGSTSDGGSSGEDYVYYFWCECNQKR